MKEPRAYCRNCRRRMKFLGRIKDDGDDVERLVWVCPNKNDCGGRMEWSFRPDRIFPVDLEELTAEDYDTVDDKHNEEDCGFASFWHYK